MVKGICDSQSGYFFKGIWCSGVSGVGGGLVKEKQGIQARERERWRVRGIEVRSTWKWKRGHDQGWGGALGHCQLKVSQLKLFIQPCVLGPDLMASHLWTPTTWVPSRCKISEREKERMSLLNQNQTLRTNGQDERTVSSGFIGDPQPSLSSEGARLGRTANSGAYEVSFNSQFIRMMFVCHHVICPCDKASLKDTGQTKGQVEANHQGHKPRRKH